MKLLESSRAFAGVRRAVTRSAWLASLVALAACSAVPEDGSGRPGPPDWQTDAGRCTWHWREGGGLGLWTQTCLLSTGRWQVAWDDRQGAFVLQHEGTDMGIVVQPWPLTPGVGVQGLTEALTRAGHLSAQADCRWRSVPMRPAPRTVAFFVLAPAAPGALGPTAQGEVPEPLCGRYGASTHGVRYFIVDLRWPDRAIFVDEGQERPMFDPTRIVVRR